MEPPELKELKGRLVFSMADASVDSPLSLQGEDILSVVAD